MVGKFREHELESLRRIAYIRGFSRAYMLALPSLAAVVTFIAYAYGTTRPILASTLFSALVVFDQISFPLMCKCVFLFPHADLENVDFNCVAYVR